MKKYKKYKNKNYSQVDANENKIFFIEMKLEIQKNSIIHTLEINLLGKNKALITNNMYFWFLQINKINTDFFHFVCVLFNFNYEMDINICP